MLMVLTGSCFTHQQQLNNTSFTSPLHKIATRLTCSLSVQIIWTATKSDISCVWSSVSFNISLIVCSVGFPPIFLQNDCRAAARCLRCTSGSVFCAVCRCPLRRSERSEFFLLEEASWPGCGGGCRGLLFILLSLSKPVLLESADTMDGGFCPDMDRVVENYERLQNRMQTMKGLAVSSLCQS